MTANPVNWRFVSAICVAVWASLAHAQVPMRPANARPAAVAKPATKMSPAQRMTPLKPIVSEATLPQANIPPVTGCVVLGDGRVFEGEVVELAAAYQVRTKNGILVLPFSEVRTVAPTLSQAYEQLRDSYRQPTMNDHLDLGRWCEQNKLFSEASDEAQSVLVLDPTRKEALSLLKRAETQLGQAAAPVESPAEQSFPRPALGVAVVSTETQVEFNRRILPLALNRCGNGTCHGASALSSFKLQQGVRPEMNLQAILEYVDADNPEMSPLLVQARTADRHHVGLFKGANGTEQYARLMAWVVQAAQDQNRLAGVRPRPKAPREGGPRYTIRPKSTVSKDIASETPADLLDTAPAEEESAPEIETVAAEEPAPTSRGPRTPRPAPLNSEAIKKLLETQDPDAFDPEEFNRMVHGNTQP